MRQLFGARVGDSLPIKLTFTESYGIYWFNKICLKTDAGVVYRFVMRTSVLTTNQFDASCGIPCPIAALHGLFPFFLFLRQNLDILFFEIFVGWAEEPASVFDLNADRWLSQQTPSNAFGSKLSRECRCFGEWSNSSKIWRCNINRIAEFDRELRILFRLLSGNYRESKHYSQFLNFHFRMLHPEHICIQISNNLFPLLRQFQI